MIYRQLPNLASLETLHLRNTQRTVNNFPSGLDKLEHLAGKHVLCIDRFKDFCSLQSEVNN